MSQYVDTFRENAIDGTELLVLTDETLRTALNICKSYQCYYYWGPLVDIYNTQILLKNLLVCPVYKSDVSKIC